VEVCLAWVLNSPSTCLAVTSPSLIVITAMFVVSFLKLHPAHHPVLCESPIKVLPDHRRGLCIPKEVFLGKL
jgi:hypothetical protein